MDEGFSDISDSRTIDILLTFIAQGITLVMQPWFTDTALNLNVHTMTSALSSRANFTIGQRGKRRLLTKRKRGRLPVFSINHHSTGVNARQANLAGVSCIRGIV